MSGWRVLQMPFMPLSDGIKSPPPPGEGRAMARTGKTGAGAGGFVDLHAQRQDLPQQSSHGFPTQNPWRPLSVQREDSVPD